MNSKQKGELAELKVQISALEKGWICSKPIGTVRYDLLIDDGDQIYRVQVKYAGHLTKRCEGAVCFTCGNGPNAPQFYTQNEIDLLLVYIPQIDKIVKLLPKDFNKKKGIQIRILPTKNNQKKSVFMANEHLW